jgi:low temperature requirement protein LtrA
MMRVREPGEHSRVTFFELFFDLVFVFAVTQISHGLAEHLDFEGAAHALILLLAMWGLWIYTTWATNWLDPNHLGVRVMLVGVMLAGLIMSAAIPEAFSSQERGLVFAACLAAANLGRTAVLVYATRHDALLQRNFERICAWLALEGGFWLAGGLADGDARVALWVCALGILYLGPPTRFPVPGLGRSELSDWNSVEGGHMAERCGLFVIIALGESLLITGATFSGLEWTAARVSAMVAAFGASVGMWWVYFDRTAEMGSERISHSDDTGRIARLAYTYIHIPIVAGIIITAVGDEVILAHPTGESHLSTALTVVGGPALFLAGYILFKQAITERFYRPLWVTMAGLLLLTLAYPALSPAALSVGSTVILLALAAWARLIHPIPVDGELDDVEITAAAEIAGEPRPAGG